MEECVDFRPSITLSFYQEISCQTCQYPERVHLHRAKVCVIVRMLNLATTLVSSSFLDFLYCGRDQSDLEKLQLVPIVNTLWHVYQGHEDNEPALPTTQIVWDRFWEDVARAFEGLTGGQGYDSERCRIIMEQLVVEEQGHVVRGLLDRPIETNLILQEELVNSMKKDLKLVKQEAEPIKEETGRSEAMAHKSRYKLRNRQQNRQTIKPAVMAEHGCISDARPKTYRQRRRAGAMEKHPRKASLRQAS